MRERVWLHLAEQAGVPVSVLKADYPEADFRLVLCKYQHEPLPGDRLDWWAARLLAAGLSPWRKKGSKPPDPKKLTPDWWKAAGPRKRQTAAGVMGLLKAFTAATGGKVSDGPARRQPVDHTQRERPARDEGAGAVPG